MTAKSLFLYGRYTKPRGVAQRRVFCERVRRKGVRGMQVRLQQGAQRRRRSSKRGSGKILRSTKFKFTWFGSEDPDSAVFPPGRPFIAEVKGPRRRDVPSSVWPQDGKGT